MEFRSSDEVLDFAMGQERRAADFYGFMAEKTSDVVARKFFREMVEEELEHEARLKAVKAGKSAGLGLKKSSQMNLTEILNDAVFKEDITLQEGLVVSMRAEKAAYEMYRDLARAAGDDELKALMESLAAEELEHKARMEGIYDQVVQREN